MTKTLPFLIFICVSLINPVSAMQDQGLNSIMSIIDKAVDSFNDELKNQEGTEDEKIEAGKAASSTVVNLSRTLGKLSYSRLQCGEADVLAEFTQRVQKMPVDFRDVMRDGFQQGFDQSKSETPLLSDDECKRLTQSRTVGDKKVEANVKEEEAKTKKKIKKVEEKPKVAIDPKLKDMRIAELSGQLAYKRKFCGDKKVVNRDFNQVISAMPEVYQAEAKKAYWKGFQHGKRLNKGLRKSSCL